MDSLFFDVLGTLTGFVAVLLLLSLIVTGLVQVTQALLRLRARNLLFGLTSVLVEQMELERSDAKAKARKILNAKAAPMFHGLLDPHGFIGKLFGPQVSWLDEKQLARILPALDFNVDADECKNIVDGIKNIDQALSKRFLRSMRVWTIVWSLAVAVYFQVTPSTLLVGSQQASPVDAATLALKAGGSQDSQSNLFQMPSQAEVSAKVLDQLGARFPAYREQLEKLGNASPSSQAIQSALSSLPPESSSGKSLAVEYEQGVHEYYRTLGLERFANVDRANRALAQLDIVPWREGEGFYVKSGHVQWVNASGVIMTIVLLSFGAPFWFNVLRSLTNLRDTLKPAAKDNDPKPDHGD